MSSPPVLDLDALLLPIPGEKPAGVALADSIRLELDEYRKEPDPLDPGTADRKPEWGKIIRITSDALATKTKDLLIGARLLEAATKKEGVPGLRDGLKLLHRLVEECWDRLHPMPEEGEGMEVRCGPFNWLNDSTRGAKFPQLLGTLALVKPNGIAISYLEWLDAGRKAELEELLPKIKPAMLRTAYEDLVATRQTLQDLSTSLDTKIGTDIAPDLLSAENPNNLGNAIGHNIRLVEELAYRCNIPLTDEAAAEQGGSPEDNSTSETPASSGTPGAVAGNREGLYRQVQQIADTLKRLEPHSPIPYLLERCVKLGALPFPELMRAIIRETSTLDELDRLMGLEKKE